jgi:hypothetical protein
MKKRNKETSMQEKQFSMMKRNLLAGYVYNEFQSHPIIAYRAFRSRELVWRNRLPLHMPDKKRLSTPRRLPLQWPKQNRMPRSSSVKVAKSFLGELGKREKASVDTPC